MDLEDEELDELIDLSSRPVKELTRKEKSKLNKEAWKMRNMNPVVKAREPVATTKGKKQRMEDFKEYLLSDPRATKVIRKTFEIAMDDDHPGQMAALKMCADRILPVSLFEPKKGGNRTAVQINITGIGESPITIDNDTGEIDENN